MKIKGITFENNRPATVTVELSLDEAGTVADRMGRATDYETVRAAEVGTDLYEGLTGGLFNRFWDDGLNGWRHGLPCRLEED